MNNTNQHTNQQQAPTIHINGTSPDELLSRILEARHGLHSVFKLLAATQPHGRDYYPQGEMDKGTGDAADAAFDRAIAEHAARMAKLRSVYEELEKMAETVAWSPYVLSVSAKHKREEESRLAVCVSCGKTEQDYAASKMGFNTSCLSIYNGRTLCPDCIPAN